MSNKTQKSAKTAPKSNQNAPKAPKTTPGASNPPKQAKKAVRKTWPTWTLLLALIGVIGGTTLFICAAAGLFGNGNQKTALSPEYLASDTSLSNSDGPFLELLTPERYQELIDQQKSFLLFIDQTDCVNANRMREFITNFASETGVKPYRMMFSDLKQADLNQSVKYYPSTVIIDRGTPKIWLDANSDADAPAFNDYSAYKEWLDNNLELQY